MNVKKGLVNGSEGTVVGFIYPYNKEYYSIQDATAQFYNKRNISPAPIVLVQFNDYKDIAYPYKGFQTVPICMVQNLEADGRPSTQIVTCGCKDGQVKIKYHKYSYPIQLAFASTVHKAQGMTLDTVVYNNGTREFAFNQRYVALSRVRKLEDLVITDPWQDGNVTPTFVKTVETVNSIYSKCSSKLDLIVIPGNWKKKETKLRRGLKRKASITADPKTIPKQKKRKKSTSQIVDVAATATKIYEKIVAENNDYKDLEFPLSYLKPLAYVSVYLMYDLTKKIYKHFHVTLPFSEDNFLDYKNIISTVSYGTGGTIKYHNIGYGKPIVFFVGCRSHTDNSGHFNLMIKSKTSRGRPHVYIYDSLRRYSLTKRLGLTFREPMTKHFAVRIFLSPNHSDNDVTFARPQQQETNACGFFALAFMIYFFKHGRLPHRMRNTFYAEEKIRQWFFEFYHGTKPIQCICNACLK